MDGGERAITIDLRTAGLRRHNLESLPPNGFEVACFPVKVHAASAGWTRAVALFDDER